MRVARHPREALRETRGLLAGTLGGRGGDAGERALGLMEVTRTITTAMGEQLTSSRDPLVVTARRLAPHDVAAIRSEAKRKVDEAVSAALAIAGAAS